MGQARRVVRGLARLVLASLGHVLEVFQLLHCCVENGFLSSVIFSRYAVKSIKRGTRIDAEAGLLGLRRGSEVRVIAVQPRYMT